jgi:hypothetical protein
MASNNNQTESVLAKFPQGLLAASGVRHTVVMLGQS